MIRLASTDFIKTAVIAQPGPFTLEQVRAIKVPCSWICPEGTHTTSVILCILSGETCSYQFQLIYFLEAIKDCKPRLSWLRGRQAAMVWNTNSKTTQARI